MEIRSCIRTAAALLAAALASGCATEPPTPEQTEKRCQSWRNYARTKPADYVLEECSHQMGLEQCKKCLNP